MSIFCKNCGSEIEEGALFCSVCGQRAEIFVQAEQPSVVEEQPAFMNEQAEPVYQPLRNVRKEAKPKTFFGKGAFALCLVVIAILSASTGMFAYLYFTLVNSLM